MAWREREGEMERKRMPERKIKTREGEGDEEGGEDGEEECL